MKLQEKTKTNKVRISISLLDDKGKSIKGETTSFNIIDANIEDVEKVIKKAISES